VDAELGDPLRDASAQLFPGRPRWSGRGGGERAEDRLSAANGCEQDVVRFVPARQRATDREARAREAELVSARQRRLQTFVIAEERCGRARVRRPRVYATDMDG